MSIFNHAFAVINEVYADEYVKQHMTPLKVTQALADAGLLAPDPMYRSAPLVGMTWDEEDGVPDGYVHLTFRVPETGRGFSAKDTATINLAGTDHAEGGAP